MKKLFSIIAALLLMFSFTACDGSLQSTVSDLESQISQLQSTIDDLEAAKTALEGENATLVADKADLTSQLEAANASLVTKTTDLATLQSQYDTLLAEKQALETQITTLTGDKTALETAKAALEAEIATLESDITTLEAEVGSLEKQVETLDAALMFDAATLNTALTFDNVIVILVADDEGYITKYVGYNDDFAGTFYDLLDANFTLDATNGTWGHMINSLEGLHPLNGQYISFYVNGQSSMVGVDSAVLEHGNVYSFELAWWDTTEESVANVIDLYLENYAADAVNATSIDYNVAAGLAHLGILEEYVSDQEVQTYVDGLTLTTWNDYVKAIIILEAADLDATSLYNGLVSIAAPAGYASTGYQLNTFAANNTTVDYLTFETTALADLNTNTPANLGIDSGGIGVMALSFYKEATSIDADALINDWVSYIKTNQTEDGIILDKDFGWGQSESSATLAQAILGLVANDVNPKGADSTGTDMTQLNYNLVSALTGMADDTGAYLGWDGNPDFGFNTPQAFLALVAYQMYSNNGNEPVNVYLFDFF